MVQDLTHCKIPHHQTVHDMTDADMDTYAEAEPGSTCCALSSSSTAPIFGTSKAGSVVVVGVSHVDGPADGVSADPIDSRDRSARIMRPASAVRRLLAAACRLPPVPWLLHYCTQVYERQITHDQIMTK